ncbi:MAG: nitroreductase family protein [Thermodesulfobacteriota bacterium]
MDSGLDNLVIAAIRTRRSVRKFTGEPVSGEELEAVLEAGRWAPSGMNNQPWRFVIVESAEKKAELAGLTHYGGIVRGAAVLVAVFLDRSACYDTVKDHQAAGACLENMLLAAHALGLGAVWLGEILRNADRVRDVLGLGRDLELQAVVALGRPERRDQASSRRPLSELILGRL